MLPVILYTVLQELSLLHVEGLYCKRPIQFLASSELLTPPSPHRPASVYPPAFGAGGGHTRWVERGWGVNKSEDARHCSVFYICKYFVLLQPGCFRGEAEWDADPRSERVDRLGVRHRDNLRRRGPPVWELWRWVQGPVLKDLLLDWGRVQGPPANFSTDTKNRNTWGLTNNFFRINIK